MTKQAEALKLNTLLAKTDQLAPSFKQGVAAYTNFFKTSQGAFKGERRTYTAIDGFADDPGKRTNVLVQTTVGEKLDYLVDGAVEYINALFSQEKTNASGTANADLIVDGKVIGNFSSLELLRLKTVLEGLGLEQMYAQIPVRSDAEDWASTTNSLYENREIFEQDLQNIVVKTTIKDQFIMVDPNVQRAIDAGKPIPNYTPTLATKDTVVVVADSTYQKFSGEWTQKQKAAVLQRRTTLVVAVVEALKRANEAVAVKSDMTADILFGYLHEGKL